MSDKCKECGSPNIYRGLNKVECPTKGCKNFSEKQLEAFNQKLDVVKEKVEEILTPVEFHSSDYYYDDETEPSCPIGCTGCDFCEEETDPQIDIKDEETDPNYSPDDYFVPLKTTNEQKQFRFTLMIDGVECKVVKKWLKWPEPEDKIAVLPEQITWIDLHCSAADDLEKWLEKINKKVYEANKIPGIDNIKKGPLG